MAEIVLASGSSVWNVFKALKAIKDALATDRGNHKEYREIVKSVDELSSLLKPWRRIAGTTESTVPSVMTSILDMDNLVGSLDEALEIIERRNGRNIIFRLFSAKDTAKALSRVNGDIQRRLQIATYAGMMMLLVANTIQLPHQGCQNIKQVSMIFISVDLECSRCYKKMLVTLFQLGEKTQAEIEFDTANSKVIVTGLFDPNRLTRMIGRKLGSIVKQIEIAKEEKEKEPDIVEGIRELVLSPQSPPHEEGIHVSSAQDERPATKEEDGCHTSRASEGPRIQPAAREHPVLLEGREASRQRPSSSLQVQVLRGTTSGHGTRLPAAAADKSHVLPHGTNRAMIHGNPKVTKCPCPRSKGVAQVRPPWR